MQTFLAKVRVGPQGMRALAVASVLAILASLLWMPALMQVRLASDPASAARIGTPATADQELYCRPRSCFWRTRDDLIKPLLKAPLPDFAPAVLVVDGYGRAPGSEVALPQAQLTWIQLIEAQLRAAPDSGIGGLGASEFMRQIDDASHLAINETQLIKGVKGIRGSAFSGDSGLEGVLLVGARYPRKSPDASALDVSAAAPAVDLGASLESGLRKAVGQGFRSIAIARIPVSKPPDMNIKDQWLEQLKLVDSAVTRADVRLVRIGTWALTPDARDPLNASFDQAWGDFRKSLEQDEYKLVHASFRFSLLILAVALMRLAMTTSFLTAKQLVAVGVISYGFGTGIAAGSDLGGAGLSIRPNVLALGVLLLSVGIGFWLKPLVEFDAKKLLFQKEQNYVD